MKLKPIWGLQLLYDSLLLTLPRGIWTTTLQLSRPYFHDRFGIEGPVLIGGGYVQMRCRFIKSSDCTGSEILYIVDPNGKEIANGPCQPDAADGLHRFMTYLLPINEATVLGEYRCKYGDQLSALSAKVLYRICDNREAACVNDDQCTNTRACVQTKDNAEASCQTLSKEICKLSHPWNTNLPGPICPTNMGTLCEYIAEGWPSRASCTLLPHLGPGRSCVLADDEYPTMRYGGVRYQFEYPIFLNDSNDMSLHVDNTQNKTLWSFGFECYVLNTERIRIYNFTHQLNVQPRDVPLHKSIFNSGSKLYKIDCVFRKDPNNPPRTMGLVNLLVRIDGRVEIRGNADGQGGYIGDIECYIDPAPTNDFRVKYEWIQRSDSTTIGNSAKLTVTKSDGYKCKAKIIYKSCAPYVTYDKDFETDFVNAGLTLPSTTSTTSTTTPSTTTTTTGTTTTGRPTAITSASPTVTVQSTSLTSTQPDHETSVTTSVPTLSTAGTGVPTSSIASAGSSASSDQSTSTVVTSTVSSTLSGETVRSTSTASITTASATVSATSAGDTESTATVQSVTPIVTLQSTSLASAPRQTEQSDAESANTPTSSLPQTITGDTSEESAISQTQIVVSSSPSTVATNGVSTPVVTITDSSSPPIITLLVPTASAGSSSRSITSSRTTSTTTKGTVIMSASTISAPGTASRATPAGTGASSPKPPVDSTTTTAGSSPNYGLAPGAYVFVGMGCWVAGG